jgi:hypothetical protein
VRHGGAKPDLLQEFRDGNGSRELVRIRILAALLHASHRQAARLEELRGVDFDIVTVENLICSGSLRPQCCIGVFLPSSQTS